MSHQTICPKCLNSLAAPFALACPSCGFTLAHLIGSPSPETQPKQDKHTELLTVGSISLHGGEFNASFDYYGLLSLPDLVRYTVSYGHHSTVPSPRGDHTNAVTVAYVPEIIGSGISRYSTGYMACSGLCIVSPGSQRWGHPYPILEQWTQQQFAGAVGACFVCGTATPFGHTLCPACYSKEGSDWRRFL
ncbi:MAG: hypothetical protein IH623_25215 [Verrucomicrobia bacterium]|nr:hypothetical protein [Verrucomicrobiota bacterium]